VPHMPADSIHADGGGGGRGKQEEMTTRQQVNNSNYQPHLGRLGQHLSIF